MTRDARRRPGSHARAIVLSSSRQQAIRGRGRTSCTGPAAYPGSPARSPPPAALGRARRPRPCRGARARRARATIRLLYAGGPLRRVRRHLHRSRPERRGRDDPRRRPRRRSPVPLTGNTGDVFEDRWNVSGAYKADLNDRLSYALIFDQPFGADTRYGAGTFTARPASPFPLRRQHGRPEHLPDHRRRSPTTSTPNVKLYGGLRAQRLDAEAAIPFVARLLGRRPTTTGATATWSAPPTSARRSRSGWR